MQLVKYLYNQNDIKAMLVPVCELEGWSVRRWEEAIDVISYLGVCEDEGRILIVSYCNKRRPEFLQPVYDYDFPTFDKTLNEAIFQKVMMSMHENRVKYSANKLDSSKVVVTVLDDETMLEKMATPFVRLLVYILNKINGFLRFLRGIK